jgi:hypothetical protein
MAPRCHGIIPPMVTPFQPDEGDVIEIAAPRFEEPQRRAVSIRERAGRRFAPA